MVLVMPLRFHDVTGAARCVLLAAGGQQSGPPPLLRQLWR